MYIHHKYIFADRFSFIIVLYFARCVVGNVYVFNKTEDTVSSSAINRNGYINNCLLFQEERAVLCNLVLTNDSDIRIMKIGFTFTCIRKG